MTRACSWASGGPGKGGIEGKGRETERAGALPAPARSHAPVARFRPPCAAASGQARQARRSAGRRKGFQRHAALQCAGIRLCAPQFRHIFQFRERHIPRLKGGFLADAAARPVSRCPAADCRVSRSAPPPRRPAARRPRGGALPRRILLPGQGDSRIRGGGRGGMIRPPSRGCRRAIVAGAAAISPPARIGRACRKGNFPPRLQNTAA